MTWAVPVEIDRIQIRYSPGRTGRLRWGAHPGWTWTCPCCNTGGRASAWSQVRRRTRTSAFTRVLRSVDAHLRERHRDEHFAYVLRNLTLPWTGADSGRPSPD